MQRILMMVEVSQKQSYIFSSNKLRDQVACSEDIRYVTSGDFFAEAGGELYREEENMVYSGGGHTVLQFAQLQQAQAFARRVTEAAMRRFDGMELFVKLLPYDEKLTPAENLKKLTAELEKKKARRKTAFHRMYLGVEQLNGAASETEACSGLPFRPRKKGAQTSSGTLHLQVPAAWNFPAQFEDLAGEDSFIAMIHIDGNAMGRRVEEIYKSGTESWEGCTACLRRFSESIQQDFEAAFREMVEDVLRMDGTVKADMLPIRPVILAGDDVCFVTRGKIGIECARLFLERLAARHNAEDGLAYSACAGVALVHKKYPAHAAYRLAEELCSNAKTFGAQLDTERRVSAMDWHIEFGQLKDSLSELRKDYATEDGNRLELRPVSVVIPEGVTVGDEERYRSYDYFRQMWKELYCNRESIARGKLKELRAVMKQGVAESEFALEDWEISDLLYHDFSARYTTEEGRREQYAELQKNEKLDKQIFRSIGDTKRCLFFDAIELLDEYQILEEVEV